MDEWYLLFQPLFENYLESMLADQRDDSDPVARRASEPLFLEKTFFNGWIYRSSDRASLADEKDD
ncbi:MAG: hypothetical protein V2I40_11810 [Desulfobacteraceae bacterium]|nr:hypothetical protein [Desulfobacteraceae bacterium]